MQPAPARQPSTAWQQPLGRAPGPQPFPLPPAGAWQPPAAQPTGMVQPMQAPYAGQPWYGATPIWPGSTAWPAAAATAGMPPQYLPSTSVPCAPMPPFAQNGPVQSMQLQQAPMSAHGQKGALPQQSTAASAFPQQQPVYAPSLPHGAATCTVGVGTAITAAALQPQPALPASTATASPPQSQRAGLPSQAAAPPGLPVLPVQQVAPAASRASTCVVQPQGAGMSTTPASAPMTLSGTYTATSTAAPSAFSTDSGGAFSVNAPAPAPGLMSMPAAAAPPLTQSTPGISGQAPAYAPSVPTVPTVGPCPVAGLGHVALEPCRVCGRRGVTVTKREPGTYSWGWVACMTLFLLPLCCIPLMAPSCLDAKEICPSCQAVYSTKTGGPDSSRAC